MENRPGTALIVGANGLFGRYLADRLEAASGWRVLRCSRTGSGSHRREVLVDLTDVGAAAELATSIPDVTHVFYAARFASADADTETAVNTSMLRNVLDAVAANGAAVQHIQLMHGTKWYGGVGDPYLTPADEDDPRARVPNFYHTQQDLLAERAPAAAWNWTTLRPHTICAPVAGQSHSLVPLLAAYAALCRQIGTQLIFPGSEACFRSMRQATDIDLLAEAAVWAATTPSCANEAFNVVNGDYFRWCELWPGIAGFFGLEPGPVQPIGLAAYTEALAPAWEELARVEGLEAKRIEDVGEWSYLDRILRSERDDMSSTAKLKRHGFDLAVDSGAMFLRMFEALREQRIIP